jgi:hypothetical protein
VSEADLVLIVDRTGSMSASDLTNAKNAAKDMLLFLDPAAQRVALGVLGPSRTNQTCGSPNGGAYGLASPSASGSNYSFLASPWPVAPPASNYQTAGGALNTSSQLVRTINCLNTSGTGTDLGSPTMWARYYLEYYGRPNAVKGIILMTDGEANEPTSQSCKYALQQAQDARNVGIEVVTIGFGVAGADCVDAASPAPSPYRNVPVTSLLAAMASPVEGVPAVDNGCTQAENTDGDNYFCEPRSSDLSQVFVTAASQIINSSPKLIALPS